MTREEERQEMAAQDLRFHSKNILMESLSSLEPFVVMLLEVNVIWMTNNTSERSLSFQRFACSSNRTARCPRRCRNSIGSFFLDDQDSMRRTTMSVTQQNSELASDSTEFADKAKKKDKHRNKLKCAWKTRWIRQSIPTTFNLVEQLL